jgi:hypothetical protein
MAITNFTDFFKEERDVYVQNISNAQVSCLFEISSGNYQSVLLPQSRDPVNFTQQIPFHIIKNSPDFRKLANRRPPVLKLMTEEEFKAYYMAKYGPNWLEGMDMAEKKRAEIASHVIPPKPSEEEETKKPDPAERVMEEDLISPKVQHLCLQVDVQIPEKEKMKASELLESLQIIEEDLTLDDLEYIRAKGFWKTVKQWAKAVVEKRNNANPVEENG